MGLVLVSKCPGFQPAFRPPVIPFHSTSAAAAAAPPASLAQTQLGRPFSDPSVDGAEKRQKGQDI